MKIAGTNPARDTHQVGLIRRSIAVMLLTMRRIWRHPANARRRWRALAWYFFWQTWERLIRRPWTIRLGSSSRIRLYPHSMVAAFVLYYDIPDYEDMSFVRDYLRPGDLFMDVGANVGLYTLWAAEVDDVEVVAFEPSTVTYERISENVELNGLSHRVAVLQQALGAEHTTVRFSTGLDAINRVLREPADSGEDVQQTSIDRVLSQESRDESGISERSPVLLKIDVEGDELSVLQGAISTISRHRPALLVEVNDPSGLADFFAEFGYVACSYEPATRQLKPTTLRKGSNAIAIADLEVARDRVQNSAHAQVNLPGPAH